MKKTIWTVAVCLVMALALGYFWMTRPKVGYVINGKVFNEYFALKDGRKLLEQKQVQMVGMVDSLEVELKALLQDYAGLEKGLKPEEKTQRQEYIRAKQMNLGKVKTGIEEQLLKEEQQMTQSVARQVNEFISQYGQENGFDFIYGSTSEGSLFYAADKYDLTDEIIDGLNKKYAGTK